MTVQDITFPSSRYSFPSSRHHRAPPARVPSLAPSAPSSRTGEDNASSSDASTAGASTTAAAGAVAAAESASTSADPSCSLCKGGSVAFWFSTAD